MWTTVIILALALNLEPNRLGIIGLLLLRPEPIRQLLVFLCSNFLVNAATGMGILFFVNRGSVLKGDTSSAIMQISMGTLALLVAAVLFTNIRMPGSKARATGPTAPTGESAAVPSSGLALVDNFTKRAGRLVQGRSLWFAGTLGVAIALPSVDFVALLLLIASSGEPFKIQTTALFTFLIVANTILLIPMIGYFAAKEKTMRTLENLRSWVLSRRRRDYAVLLTIAGALMVTVGLNRLR
ncbi:MAG: GAP family protein [Mycobacterium sp.]|nr:GAP family protein [Mycobacterium sp.]